MMMIEIADEKRRDHHHDGFMLTNVPTAQKLKTGGGSISCKVWDYRSCLSKLGDNDSSGDENPKVQKACLRMGMENVVKDLPSILDASWSYNDILEVESRITKVLQPELFLSPDPSLSRLCRPTFKKQLDLGMSRGTSTRKQDDVSEINLDPADITHPRDISRNVCCDSLKSQPLGGTCFSDLHAILRGMPNVQNSDIIMTHVSDHALPVEFGTNYKSSSAANVVAVNSNSLLAPEQSIKGSSSRLKEFTFLPEKRDRCEYQLVHEQSPKRLKQGTPFSNYVQHSSSQRNILFEKELQKNIAPLEKHIEFQGMLQSRICDVSYPQSETNGTVLGGIPKLEAQMPSLTYPGGPRYSVKEALPGIKILPKAEAGVDMKNHVLEVGSDKSNQPQPLSFKSPLPHQRQGNSTGHSPSLEKGTKKTGSSRKRKSTQAPLVSARDSVRSPVSNLGENHNLPTLASYSTCTEVKDIRCHMDKAAQIRPVSVVNASASSDVVHSLPQNTKKIPKSHIRVTYLNKGCSGSSATVSDSSLQSNSSLIGTTHVLPLSGCSGDLSTLERLSKIVRVVTRHGLSNEKKRVGESLTSKSICHFPVAHMTSLLMPEFFEESTSLTGKMCISKLLIGGNRNICKTRIMTFVRVIFQGNSCPLPFFNSWKLILFESEKPDNHEVGAELIFGQEGSMHIAQFPSPHHADLFADQFILLMEREGYELKNDEIRPTRTSFSDASSSNSIHICSCSDTGLSCAAPTTVQSLKQVGNLGSRNSILNPPQLFSPQKLLTPITVPSCFNSTGPKQYDNFACQSSLQQHHSHNRRSMRSLQDPLLGNSHMHMGGQLLNSSTSPYSVQFQQHLQQQDQNQKILLSKMHGLGAIGNEIGMGAHLSTSTVYQMGDNLWQISGFSQPGVQSLNGGNSPDQATPRSKPRQASIQHTGVMDGIGIFRITGDGSFVGRAHQSCHIGQSHDPDNIWIGPSNAPLGHMDSKRHEHLKQICIQQELVSSPLQVGSPIVTQMSQSTPGSPRELSSGSTPHLVNASVANKHSPHHCS